MYLLQSESRNVTVQSLCYFVTRICSREIIDVAVIQSLVRKGVVRDLVGEYGQVIVDECHHLSASSFEQVVRRAKARFVLGLSATVARKDGHHPIVFMQCGPVRHRVDAKAQAAARPFVHTVMVRPTSFRPLRAADPDARIQFQELYNELIQDDDRNRLSNRSRPGNHFLVN